MFFCSSLLDLVLQVEGAITNGCRLCVAQCALSSEEREKLATGNNQDELPMENEERYFKPAITFTQRSCMAFAVRTCKIGDCLLISPAISQSYPRSSFLFHIRMQREQHQQQQQQQFSWC